MVSNNYSLKLKKIIFLVVIFLITGIKAFTQCPVKPDFNYNQYCDSLEFINTSNPIKEIDSVLWDFGDGISGITKISPYDTTHTYTTEGEYYVSLTLYHNSGCDTSKIDTIYYFYPESNFTYSLGCSGDTSFFFDASQANSESLISWSWDFGDGNTGTVANPNNIYSKHGIYDVTLIVENNLSCIDDILQEIIIEGPDAGFWADTVCFGNSTQFYDTSVVLNIPVTEWFWDFGDGGTSTLQNPAYIFSTPGIHDVKLVVTDNAGCTDSTNHDILVNLLPVADFIYTLSCPGDTTYFYDQSVHNADSIISWSWDFDDGNLSTQKDPKNVFLNSGVYNVELNVTNNFGCTDDTTRQVIVEKPIAGFWADTVCFVNATQFYDTSVVLTVPVTEWFWDFGDGGTSTLQNPTHKFSTPGIHDVKLVVTDNAGCTDSTNHDILVDFLPEANFTYTNPCSGDTTFFFDESFANADSLISWFWDFGGTGTSTDQNPGHLFLSNGIYDVILTVQNNHGCTDDTLKQVTIETPVAAFWSDTVCFGDSTQFYNTSSYNVYEIDSVVWDFGDGYYSNEYEPKHLYSFNGVDTATLIVFNTIGCVDSIKHEVRVDSLPVADFIAPDSACTGQEVCFFDNSIANSDSISQWMWQFGDGGFSFEENPCYTYIQHGEYELKHVVINSNGCASAIKYDTIRIIDTLAPAFSVSQSCFGDSTYFINETDTQGVEVLYWEWNFNDPDSGADNISNLMNPSHLFTHSGLFDVRLVVANIVGCADTIINTIVVDSLPEAAFAFPDTVPVGFEITFEDLSVPHGSPIFTRFWDFGDGTTIMNPNPVVHTYTESGTYNICLIITAINGCTDTVCDPIKITAIPKADFYYLSNVDLETYFYDSSIPDSIIVDWFWDFGNLLVTDDTISGVKNPYYNGYSDEGYYSVYLKVFDRFGGIHDTLKLIYVGRSLMADYNTTGVCLGDTTSFYDNSYSPVSAPIETWYWNFGDGTDTAYIEQAETITHYYDTTGVYNVKLIITTVLYGNFVSDTLIKEINIFSQPVANFSSEGVCFGTDTEFIDSSYTDIGNAVTSWFWDFDDDGYTSTLQNPTHGYNEVGEYNVFLEITTAYGCVDTITNKSYVSYAPDIPFHVENNCLNSPAYFIPDYDSTEIKITSWLWDFGDPYDDTTSTEPFPEHTYTRIMNYKVTMIASTHNCPKEKIMNILVFPIPYSSFTLTPDYGDVQGRTKFSNQSIYAHHYLWDFGNGNTSEVMNPIEVYEEDSTYIVTLVSYNEYNCSDTSRLELLVFFRGLYFPTAFSPNNPNSEISRFTPKGVNLAEYQVQVFDLRGNLLWESDKLDDSGSPVESWDGYYEGRLMPEGMYIWRASGLFKDGSVWKGSTFQSENPQTQGTVTLVR